jgi:uncharacterized surface protein with fasciclin (FAS1) repeats
LVQAADAVGYVEDPESSITLFAPTNAAFERLLMTLGVSAEELLADTETVASVLQCK